MKVDDTEVINFLLSTEIIPLCLRTMELGSELSKTVATFIVQKILSDGSAGDTCSGRAERCCSGRIGFRGDGRTVGRTAEREIAEAHREVLFTVER